MKHSDAGQGETRVLGFGDNVVDRYLDAGLMYPGGNALNVAAYAKMLGAQAAYLGTFGSDRAGRHVRDTLKTLGIAADRSHILAGENGHADVRIVGGNREFVFSNRGGVAREHPFDPSDDDLAYIGGFDLVHTSCYSHIDPHLARIAGTSRLLSYDFSYRWQGGEAIAQVAPHLDFAALSAGDAGRDGARRALKEVLARGCPMALATLGADGALLATADDLLEVPAAPAQIVDTLGAGDAFIAATLLGLLRSGWRRGAVPARGDILAAMRQGAAFAARICTIEGAFGHAAPIDAETPS